ncbi:N-acetyl sugar amidotransferase [Synechococcus sp. UW105]|uniref:N-acetyl sugar amidotransferase n=1 Tax=Synechococcus sp. UW105 TaxID=337067 RepID=UPI0018E069DD|nr:N-acetyl sugar amidotransferase [Synechococcus sp. UW105]
MTETAMYRLNPDISLANVRICSRCIYDERVPSITFDSEGVCNYCRQVESLSAQYATGKLNGKNRLKKIIDEIRFEGRKKRYDCVIGVSGGTDSSYLIHWAVEQGLRPLAVHYDNTWNTAIATQNIRKVLFSTGVDLYTHVVNNKEIDDIFRSFFFAGVAEIEASTDLGYAYTLRRVAAKYGISAILEGHSFIEEGITPLGRNYFDGKYIQSIHRLFGEQQLRTYPLMTFSRFLKSAIIDKPKFIRPLWYLNYSKEEAQLLLNQRYGWQYYGGHHLENRMTAFYHSIYMPEKFGGDLRNNTLAARVRNGSMDRATAWAEYNSPPIVERQLLDYFLKRLNISPSEYSLVMSEPPRDWSEFPTYKRRFERFRLLFKLLAKADLVPMSFYLKYCFPSK